MAIELSGLSSGTAASTAAAASGIAGQRSVDTESLQGRLRLGASTSPDGDREKDLSASRSPATACSTDDDSSSIYVTRYHIDHEIQTKKLCGEAVFEECAPFCDVEATRTPIGWIWSFVRSELFLYSLHLTAIALGAFKEAMDLRGFDPFLELEHSIIETTATLAFVLIRMANAHMGYSMIRNTIGRIEQFDPKRDARLRSMWMWLWLFQAASLLLVAVCVVSFVIFYKWVHLGWTLVSNQFCLITSMVLAGLYMARVTVSVVKIREDQHKAVVYEAMLLLQEFCLNRDNDHDALLSRSPTDDVTVIECDDNAPVRTFVRAMSNTGLFKPPSHISLRVTGPQQRDELRQFINSSDKYDNIRRYCEEILNETLI